MLEGFKCPDGQITTLQQCLAGCRMIERCLTLPTLTYISQEREWTGEPSTTQMLNGTMMEFLKLTQPYAIDPDSRAFSLAGTLHHLKLEEVAKELGLPAEVALTGEDRDIIDLLEQENGEWTITDYKNWGSYRVAKLLGLVETGKQPDPSGVLYKTSGKWGKAGTPKMIPVFQRMAQAADAREVELQLNNYRLKVKEKYGLDITKLRVQVTVRDGGLAVATSRGITRNMTLIPVKILPDVEVAAYFSAKRNDLLKVLEVGECHTVCNNEECWDGTRCRGYCDVWNFCPKGMVEHGGK